MSMRTIVEFNHDYAGEIERDPEGFLKAIRRMLQSGVTERESIYHHVLKQYGITTSPTHHHSSQSDLSLTHQDGTEYHRQRFS